MGKHRNNKGSSAHIERKSIKRSFRAGGRTSGRMDELEEGRAGRRTSGRKEYWKWISSM